MMWFSIFTKSEFKPSRHQQSEFTGCGVLVPVVLVLLVVWRLDWLREAASNSASTTNSPR